MNIYKLLLKSRFRSKTGEYQISTGAYHYTETCPSALS